MTMVNVKDLPAFTFHSRKVSLITMHVWRTRIKNDAMGIWLREHCKGAWAPAFVSAEFSSRYGCLPATTRPTHSGVCKMVVDFDREEDAVLFALAWT